MARFDVMRLELMAREILDETRTDLGRIAAETPLDQLCIYEYEFTLEDTPHLSRPDAYFVGGMLAQNISGLGLDRDMLLSQVRIRYRDNTITFYCEVWVLPTAEFLRLSGRTVQVVHG